MKISTSFLFDRATERMSTIQNQLAATQAQMAVSKKILAPSDSPDQAAAIQRLKGEIERQGSQQRSMNVALRRYTAEESALKSSVDLLTRMKELGIKAANDTLGPADRKAIAVEMRSIRDQLLSTGNSQDDNGNYIFSATRVNTPAFAEDDNGNVIYQGDQTQTSIPAGVERSVNFTRSGTDIFSRVIRTDSAGNEQSVGFFKAIDEMVAAVEASNTSGIQQGIGDTSQMFNSVTFALAQTGSDQVVVQSQIDMLDETALRLKSTLSDVEDLDYAEAATRMNKEMMALEAAMSSFAKISGMNLFDYIRS